MDRVEITSTTLRSRTEAEAGIHTPFIYHRKQRRTGKDQKAKAVVSVKSKGVDKLVGVANVAS